MVFYTAFNSISVISRRQLTLFMLSWVSPVLGWALKSLAQGHSHEITQVIQCGSNSGPLDYESSTLPLSHGGPMWKKEKMLVTSIFSFPTFSKSLIPRVVKHRRLCGKGLKSTEIIVRAKATIIYRTVDQEVSHYYKYEFENWVKKKT